MVGKGGRGWGAGSPEDGETKGIIFWLMMCVYLLQCIDLVLRYPYEGGEQKGKPARQKKSLVKENLQGRI
jgi:hypothetical protein